MATQNKQCKLIGYVNYRMRATLKDGRQIVGQMLAFDKHMNLVLADAEELRKIKKKTKEQANKIVETEEKRSLGLAIVRGQEVVACIVEGPPPADPSARLGTEAKPSGVPAASAPGISRPAGRGAGLQGPAGFGGFPGAPQFPPAGAPFAGRGGPAGFPPAGFAPPPQGFAPPPGFQAPGGGRGFPPPPGFQR